MFNKPKNSPSFMFFRFNKISEQRIKIGISFSSRTLVSNFHLCFSVLARCLNREFWLALACASELLGAVFVCVFQLWQVVGTEGTELSFRTPMSSFCLCFSVLVRCRSRRNSWNRHYLELQNSDMSSFCLCFSVLARCRSRRNSWNRSTSTCSRFWTASGRESGTMFSKPKNSPMRSKNSKQRSVW